MQLNQKNIPGERTLPVPADSRRTLTQSQETDNMAALWEYIGACTARGAASVRTKAAYGASIARYLAWCSARDLKAVEAQRRDVEDWRADLLAAGSSPGTVMLRLSAVRTLYKALCRAGKCAGNPAEHVKSPRPTEAAVDAVMRKIVPTDAMMAALGKIEDDARGRRDRALLLAMYLLGLRVSEAAGLDWEDWKGDTLAFRAKGGQTRELSAPEALKAALASLRGTETAHGPMFIGDGGRFTVRGIQKMVSVRLAAAGMADRSPHALRHSCATVAAIGGASPWAVQDQMGHASQRTTSIYTRAAGRFLEAPSLVVERAMGI